MGLSGAEGFASEFAVMPEPGAVQAFDLPAVEDVSADHRLISPFYSSILSRQLGMTPPELPRAVAARSPTA